MNIDTLLGLTTFAFITSITPGPNNLMLLASGTNYGFRRTVPHMLGVALGFVFMLIVVGAGLVQLFDAYPVIHQILKAISIIYLLYLAWRITQAASPAANQAAGRPFTFMQAAVFQWVNPKAWAMALTAVTVYSVSRSPGEIVLIAVVFGAINLPAVGSWAVLGQYMRRLLTSSQRLRNFNLAMALLLVASLYPVLFS